MPDQEPSASSVNQVLDGLLAPLSRPSTPQDRFVLVKGLSGLGNRMLAATAGTLYAALSGRKLLVDWRDPLYSSDGSNVFHRFFKSVSCSADDPMPVTDSIYPKLWQKRLHYTARQLAMERGYTAAAVRRELSIDPSRLDYPEGLVVFVDYRARLSLLRPHFRGRFEELSPMSDAAILSGILRRDFALQPDIQERVEAFQREHFRAPTVGVHVRYSDRSSRLLAIISSLNQLLAREPRCRIFIATDNIEILKMFERSYSGVVATAHWYGAPGASIHRNSANPDATATAIEALIDLYLLAECDHLIVDESSTFAVVANLLSSAPRQNRIKVASDGQGNRFLRSALIRLQRATSFSWWAFRLLPRLLSIRKL
jgi:hypothetical protein